MTDIDLEKSVRKRPGRPPKDVRMKEFPVHFYMPSQEMLDRLKKAAEIEGMSFSTWARTLLLREAGRVLQKE